MSKEILINEFIESLIIDKNKIEDLSKIDFKVMDYSYDISSLFNLIEKYQSDEVDIYQFDLVSKVVLIITEGDPLINLKLIISNIILNKKVVLFINNNFVGINTFLINKMTNLKINYNLNSEIYLDTNNNYNKYIKVENKFDEIIYIGKQEAFEKIKKDFNNLKYISE